MKPCVTIDTNVMISMILEDQPHHQEAIKVYNKIKDENWRVILPLTSVYENQCVLKRERLKGKLLLSRSFEGLEYDTIDISNKNFDEYFFPDLPYTKAGDMLFLSIAKRWCIPLITEDKKLLRAGKDAGIVAVNCEGFLKILIA